MRKNLHYKVLASVLAIAGLYFYNAPAAWAAIEKVENANVWAGNGTIIGNIEQETGKDIPLDAYVYGKYNPTNNNEEANGNIITINNSTLSKVCGGYSHSNNANGNTVTITNSTFTDLGITVLGGQSEFSNAYNNNVLITGDSNNLYAVAGRSTGAGKATGNTVTINGDVTLTGSSNVSYIADGQGASGSTVSDNHVIIEGGTVTGNIYGGFGMLYADSTTISGNKITVKNSANVEKAKLYGGYANSSTATISNNTLTLDGWSGSVNSVNNFSDIYINNFTLNKNLIDVGSVNGMDGVTIHLGTFTATKDDFKINAGDYAVGDNVKAATIEWDKKLGSKVDFTIKDEDGNDVHAFEKSLANQTINNTFYTANRTGGGVYATKFYNESGYSTSHKNDTNFVSITAKVEKSILAGKFIDENGQEHTNTQTQNRILTIGEGFTTKVGTVAGAYAVGDNAAENGEINIRGNTNYSGTVYAGYSESGEVKDNKINVATNTKAQYMSLSGYNTSGTDNTLNIAGNGSEFNNISNFETINFDKVALNSNAALTVRSADVSGTIINVNSLAGGQTFSVNDTLNLIAGTLTGKATLNLDDKVTAGLTQDLSLEETINSNGIQLAVKDVSMNNQINLVAENRAVAAAFVNQGTDLISDSLDTLSRDGSYGVKTFAAVHGNRSKYDVNSDLKINGWSTIVGVGNAAEFADGDEFSWGVFYENGSGNYRTFNEFNNEFFRGDGSLVYNGGGIAARYENASGVYTEGSLRAGMLKSEMDNALRDGSGNYYGYNSESAYYGAHIGVGKIISLSESSDLDVYGKFFHTYTEGDSFTVDKDKFEFDSITSDRLRIGARVTTNKANAFSTYYGLAYEYEFNGDADMRAQNLKAPTQSLQGSSYMAEVGFNYQPTPDSPWSFDLNMRGYAGEREGASFNVQATYTF